MELFFDGKIAEIMRTRQQLRHRKDFWSIFCAVGISHVVITFFSHFFADEHAPWKRIQQNTFTRWVNEQLKCIDGHIDDLATDFADGVALIHLVQVRLVVFLG